MRGREAGGVARARDAVGGGLLERVEGAGYCALEFANWCAESVLSGVGGGSILRTWGAGVLRPYMNPARDRRTVITLAGVRLGGDRR